MCTGVLFVPHPVFMIAVLTDMKDISFSSLFTFPRWSMVLNVFGIPVGCWDIFFETHLFRSFAYFKIELFYYYEFSESLVYFGY